MVSPRTVRRLRSSTPLRRDSRLPGDSRHGRGPSGTRGGLRSVGAAGAQPPPEEGRPRRVRVLVVDDEPAIRALCRVNLQVAGLEVVEAVDGAEALALAARELPDIVLLDVMMPRLDGWEVARRLRSEETTREIPVVFLSARTAPEDRRRGYEAGAVGYVAKPFDPLVLGDALMATLERIAAGEREQLRRELLGKA